MPAYRIGFLDCDLDNFPANVYLEALRGPLSDRGYQIVGATADVTDANRAWCEMKSVPWFDSVLPPSNPERHWATLRCNFA